MPTPAPSDLQLSGLTINEGDLIGVRVGSLVTIGSDGTTLAAQGLSYALVAGDGSEDNSSFQLNNGQLLARQVFDRETREQLRVRIRVSDAEARSFEKSFTIRVHDLNNPIATAPLASPPVAWQGSDGLLDLGSFFDDPFSSGRVATFTLAPVQLGANAQATVGSGRLEVLLYDQAGKGAPLTSANLQAYLSANSYNNTLIHRSVPGFVLQGGGFNLVTLAQGASLIPVTTLPAVANEYNAARSNLRGTVAMAKLGSNPNSATSQWFWNLADNSANLDNQNGGFTVFGRLLGASDLATLDAMAELPVRDASSSLGSVYSALPLSSGNLTVNNLLRFSSITIGQRAELSYAVIANSAAELLEATLTGSQLKLRSLANREQQAMVTIRATNLLGESVDQTLQLQLLRRPTTEASILRLNDTAGNTSPNLALPSLAGSLTTPLQADERVTILADGLPIGVANAVPGTTSWSFRPSTALTPGPGGTLALEARVETLKGVEGKVSSRWGLTLGTAARLEVPGSELLQVGDARPLTVQPTPIGRWDSGFGAWNAGSRTAAGQRLPGTGQRLPIQGLNRYAISLRNATGSQVSLDLGPGNHAFFLHDAWSPQSSELTPQLDSLGRTTAARFDQLKSIRLGDCTAAGATSLVDLTSPDFITGPLTVLAGNTVGSRHVIWGSSSDETVIGGAADTLIFGGAGRNTLQLGSGTDQLQYVVAGGATDTIRHFDPSRDRIELWGLAPGTSPTLSLQASGADSVLRWEGNTLTFTGLSLTLPAGGVMPSWLTTA
jgi:cyclophilin family peptidyl-prolyl cis-trans isomerase